MTPEERASILAGAEESNAQLGFEIQKRDGAIKLVGWSTDVTICSFWDKIQTKDTGRG